MTTPCRCDEDRTVVSKTLLDLVNDGTLIRFTSNNIYRLEYICDESICVDINNHLLAYFWIVAVHMEPTVRVVCRASFGDVFELGEEELHQMHVEDKLIVYGIQYVW